MNKRPLHSRIINWEKVGEIFLQPFPSCFLPKPVLFVVLLFLFGSCYKQQIVEARFSFPEIQTKIVVNCILTPSDSVFASVHKLLNVYAQSGSYPNYSDGIRNATVVLTDLTTQQKTTLPFLAKNGLYGTSQTKMKITEGHRYQLTVAAPTFQTVTATCKIPEKAAFFEGFTYSEPYTTGSLGRRRVEGRWQGIVSNDSLYYGINLVSQSQFKDEITSFSSTYFSKDITKSANTYFYQGTTTNNLFPKIYTLLTTEKNLYNYYVSAERINDITRSGTGDFFGAYQGIIPEYTNIKNGYGVFGGCVGSKFVLQFK